MIDTKRADHAVRECKESSEPETQTDGLTSIPYQQHCFMLGSSNP
jgi:hypothetical protein